MRDHLPAFCGGRTALGCRGEDGPHHWWGDGSVPVVRAAGKHGRLHGPAGMDFFIFPRDLPIKMPDFAVGRVSWDSRLVRKCRMDRIPVIGATGTIVALHQNHDYTQLALGRQHEHGPERDLNLRAAGGLSHLLTLREADYNLAAGRLSRPP